MYKRQDLTNAIKDLIHSKDRLKKMSKASLSLSLPNAVNKISKEAIALINNV